MSFCLDPREVLLHLRELGYDTITTDQLRDFMKDLKKLIRYEEKQRYLDEDQENFFMNRPNTWNRPSENVFDTLYAKETASTKAKTVPKKESIIAVHISKPIRKVCDSTKTCEHRGESSTETNPLESESTCSDFNKSKEIDKETVKTRPKSSASGKTRETRTEPDLRPKSSFIRPRIPIKTTKSDPVALYQKYQEEWKKAKIPGENNRAALRWAIRERLMGST